MKASGDRSDAQIAHAKGRKCRFVPSAGFVFGPAFLVADVRDGLGLFLGIFLPSVAGRREDIGLLDVRRRYRRPAGDPARRLHHSTARGISACCWPKVCLVITLTTPAALV